MVYVASGILSNDGLLVSTLQLLMHPFEKAGGSRAADQGPDRDQTLVSLY